MRCQVLGFVDDHILLRNRTTTDIGQRLDFQQPEVNQLLVPAFAFAALFHGTEQGFAHPGLSLFSVQYHPEARPGPRDASYLFATRSTVGVSVTKAFERSAPISALVPADAAGPMDQGRIALTVNGELRQEGDLNQMIWKVPEMIAYLSEHFTLAAGDLIMAGTPAGVGPVQRGDRLEGHIDGVGDLSVIVT